MRFNAQYSMITLPTSTIVQGNSARTICYYIKRRENVDLGGENYAFGFGTSSNSQSFNSRFGSGKIGFMGCTFATARASWY